MAFPHTLVSSYSPRHPYLFLLTFSLHSPTDKPSPASQKPLSFVTADTPPPLLEHTGAPSTNTPTSQDDSDAMGGPQLHITSATPISGTPFTNDLAEHGFFPPPSLLHVSDPASPPPTRDTEATPQTRNLLSNPQIIPDLDNSQPNNQHLGRGRPRTDTPSQPPTWDIPPFGPSLSNNVTKVNPHIILHDIWGFQHPVPQPTITRRRRSDRGRVSMHRSWKSEGGTSEPPSDFVDRVGAGDSDAGRHQILLSTEIPPGTRGHRKTTSNYIGGFVWLGAPNSFHINLSPSPHPSPPLGDDPVPHIPGRPFHEASSNGFPPGDTRETNLDFCPGDSTSDMRPPLSCEPAHKTDSSISMNGVCSFYAHLSCNTCSILIPFIVGNQDSCFHHQQPSSPRSSTHHQSPGPFSNPTQDWPSDDQISPPQPPGLSYHPLQSNSPSPGAAVQMGGTQLSKSDSKSQQQTFVQVESLHTVNNVSTAHDLLYTGSVDLERSGKQQEEVTKVTGVVLVDPPTKPPPPQTSTLDVISAHMHGIKLEGGPRSVIPDCPSNTNTTSMVENGVFSTPLLPALCPC